MPQNNVPFQRNSAYDLVSLALANRGDFAGELKAAHMIEKTPTGIDVWSLMRIYEKQWEAGNRQDAAKTLEEALDTIQGYRVQKEPPVPKLYIGQMYARVADA